MTYATFRQKYWKTMEDFPAFSTASFFAMVRNPLSTT